VNTVTPGADEQARIARRAGRLAAQELLWDLAHMDRLRTCGRRGVLPGGAVRVRATGTGSDRRAGFAGLATCGSVWSCPVCSAKILGHRKAELEQGITSWTSAGNSLALLTLTMRHRKGQSLRSLWDGVSTAWRAVVTSGSWKRAAKSLGVAGYVRVTEVTQGENGWHVHLHLGLFLDGQAGTDTAAALEAAAFSGWSRSLVRQGFEAPHRGVGVDCKLWRLGGDGRLWEYFTKGQYDDGATRAALELARGDIKEARGGNRTPFRILSDISAFGLADDVALWQEWERESKGRRNMIWSRGLRDLLAIGQELTDEELAAQELGTADDDLVELDAASFAYVARNGFRFMLLELAEVDDGGRQLRAYLDARGIPWTDCRARSIA